MNIRLVIKLLGILSGLIGGFMLFSLPWAWPALGQHSRVSDRFQGIADSFETQGFYGLLFSSIVCITIGGLMYWSGRSRGGRLFRKDAMAVVGLGWLMATVLGALPYYFSGTIRGPAVRLFSPDSRPQIAAPHWQVWNTWDAVDVLEPDEYRVIQALLRSSAIGLSEYEARGTVDDFVSVFDRLREEPHWNAVLAAPGEDRVSAERASKFRIRWVKMGVVDCLFESQSGFSTTGATVISSLEDPYLVPHCILFWRSSSHFLGGLGIIVLFVVILGQGSAGKALMRAEMPGPTKEGPAARMQHVAWLFAAVYVVLNIVLTAILWLEGMTVFDATCHAFGTMATGGFSTYDASIGHFNSPLIDLTIVAFMGLAGTNFTLLMLLLLLKPQMMWRDIEWRAYVLIIICGTAVAVMLGMAAGTDGFGTIGNAFRFGLFQVVSIVTTTGYGTNDFDSWAYFGKAMLLVLMFIGGSSGSTGGGMKVIRHVLFFKVMRIEIERAYHPRVVRLLKIGDKPIQDSDLPKSILVYFCVILILFVGSWMFVVATEPDSTWGDHAEHKLIDSASAVAATLNNIGPGLGTVGPTQNYGHLSSLTKLLFVWLMMLGRLEVYAVLVLFIPGFWRDQ